ncbi:hypothetical protein BGZ61DRAFT_532089 [Ilyonectria robusta]|uniref:uncharacterized protein n=1 Tax=Ilyonectria robusta TaxID=1079257 RepID=UPI001E8D0A1A|nr:uncharacterized protein BGZ61DRAFT_532089 [Ilyonectria robusta]KAH8699592.1 hypothetical protein BGZ61DRAFT_532089 [Ilyonectria robusta]
MDGLPSYPASHRSLLYDLEFLTDETGRRVAIWLLGWMVQLAFGAPTLTPEFQPSQSSIALTELEVKRRPRSANNGEFSRIMSPDAWRPLQQQVGVDSILKYVVAETSKGGHS